MSALQNCCITVKAPEYGGMDNGGLPTVQSDWNQTGSATRRTNSSGPYSATNTRVISRPSVTMRRKSHGGQWP